MHIPDGHHQRVPVRDTLHTRHLELGFSENWVLQRTGYFIELGITENWEFQRTGNFGRSAPPHRPTARMPAEDLFITQLPTTHQPTKHAHHTRLITHPSGRIAHSHAANTSAATGTNALFWSRARRSRYRLKNTRRARVCKARRQQQQQASKLWRKNYNRRRNQTPTNPARGQAD